MAGSPVWRRGDGRRHIGVLAGHSLGLFVGATVTASILYVLGTFWIPSMLMIGSIALVLGAIRFLRPNTVALGGFEVPRHWEILGPVPYLSVFGVFLGTGLITTMPSATMVALVLWAWEAHNLALIAAVFWGFAAARLGTSVAASVTSRRLHAPGEFAADTVEQRVRFLARVEAMVCLALGVILLTAAFGT